MKRGLSEESLERFGIGYAPDSWDALLSAARRQRIGERQLVAAGLVVPREGEGGGHGCYDRFRNRLMFPIIDPAGLTIAFGGRALAADERAKYINSPESVLFDKSSNLYALNWSREAISSGGQAVVVEGYMDAAIPLQAGVNNVVATLGTALTDRHVRLLSRYAKEVVLVFDADKAGQMAAERGLEIFLAQRMHVRVVTIPEGKDPCDFVLARGGEAFKQLIAEAPDALQYAWAQRSAAMQAAGDNLAGRNRLIEEFLTLVVSSESFGAIDEIRRGQLAQHIGHVLNIPSADLQQQMRRLGRRFTRGPTVQPPPQSLPADPATLVERHLLEALLNRPDLYGTAAERIGPEDFADPTFAHVAKGLWASASAGRGGLEDLLTMEELSSQASLLADLALAGQRRGNHEQMICDAVQFMASKKHKQDTDKLKSMGITEDALWELNRRIRFPVPKDDPKITHPKIS